MVVTFSEIGITETAKVMLTEIDHRFSRGEKVYVQRLIGWVISSGQFESRVDAVLQSVLDTEITPELVPTSEEEELRSSQAKVRPFALQDFSPFDVLRYRFRLEQVVH